MKIFNNFDTNLKKNEYSDEIKKHGEKGVLLVERTFAYWVTHGIIPLIIYVFILIGLLIILFTYLSEINFISLFFMGFILLFSLFTLNYILNRYLDYKMDFTIVTEEGIFTFKQQGVFNSKNKDLPATKIRSISSDRQGMLGNIFSYGEIAVITDGSLTTRDEEGRHQGGKMIMTYVKDPNDMRKKIIEICLKNKKM